jgi:hypothetical protein
MTPATAKLIAAALHAPLYTERRNHPVDNAQENLSGRTHYADTATLRFHKSRILSARPMMSGAFFLVIESCALDYNNSKRGARAVLFDLLGDTVYRPKLEECHRTRAQASAAYWRWLESFDPVDHYRNTLQRKAERLQAQSYELIDACEAIQAMQEAA